MPLSPSSLLSLWNSLEFLLGIWALLAKLSQEHYDTLHFKITSICGLAKMNFWLMLYGSSRVPKLFLNILLLIFYSVICTIIFFSFIFSYIIISMFLQGKSRHSEVSFLKPTIKITTNLLQEAATIYHFYYQYSFHLWQKKFVQY